jgi:imidazolonepropionase-like amidohydrolase
MKILIKSGTVIDCTGASPARRDVIVHDGKISAIESEQTRSPAEKYDQTIDASGKWVMPGLINMHDHLMMRDLIGHPVLRMAKGPAKLALNCVRNALTALRRGWTTIRDMTAPDGWALAYRDLIAQGDMPGPRVISCGASIAVTGGHASIYCIEADGVDEVRKAARQQLKAGADFIKVMASHDPIYIRGPEKTQPEMTLDEIRAAFEEAKVRGKRTACHAMGTVALDRVLTAGVDVISHGYYLSKEQAARMKEQGVFLDPTLSAYGRHTMGPKLNRGEAWAAAHRMLLEPLESSFKNALAAGVTMVTGTDTAGQYSDDVEMMRDFGMDAMASLLACTKNAALAVDLQDKIGTIEVDKIADILILNSDPLANAQNLKEVEWVIQAGSPIRPAEITLNSPV